METLETLENGEGNTKPPLSSRCVPSKYWCFTLNNYVLGDLETLETTFNKLCPLWVFGKEVAPTTGMQHLQGYCEFATKVRPKECKGLEGFKFHWEKRKGNSKQAYDYCCKEGDYYTNRRKAKKIPCLDYEELYAWQKNCVNLVDKVADDRTVLWYVDKLGCSGKSALCRFLTLTRKAVCVYGTANDMKYAITKYVDVDDLHEWPEIVVVDIPRRINRVCYEGLEEIKNGHFFSPKYESKACIGCFPHVIVFANEEPDYGSFTEDRWKIFHIDCEAEKLEKKLMPLLWEL